MENYCHAYMDQAFKKKELLYVHEEVIRMVSSILWEACDDELREGIEKALAVNENAGMEAGKYRIKAPIPVPMQDIICLGVNYRAHIEETTDVLDFTKKSGDPLLCE